MLPLKLFRVHEKAFVEWSGPLGCLATYYKGCSDQPVDTLLAACRPGLHAITACPTVARPPLLQDCAFHEEHRDRGEAPSGGLERAVTIAELRSGHQRIWMCVKVAHEAEKGVFDDLGVRV